VLLHFLFDKRYGLGGNITSKIIEAWKLSQEREECVAYSASKLHKIANNSLFLMEFSKISNFDHFPFEVSPIPKEVALMELIKLIPHFLGIIFSHLILLLGALGKIFC
jgi:hypothetical protein